MARGKCTPEQVAACPLRKHYSDSDHIVAQRYRKPENIPPQYKHLAHLIAQYIDTPENRQQLCRYEHNQKTGSEAELLENCLPDETFMLNALGRALGETA